MSNHKIVIICNTGTTVQGIQCAITGKSEVMHIVNNLSVLGNAVKIDQILFVKLSDAI